MSMAYMGESVDQSFELLNELGSSIQVMYRYYPPYLVELHPQCGAQFARRGKRAL